MAKKKLLSEAQVRRFMGLAGMNATVVSNVINEMGSYMEKDEDPADEEPDMAMDDEPMDMGGEDAADEPMDAMPEPAADAGDEDREVSIEEEDIEALEMILAKLKGEEPAEMESEDEREWEKKERGGGEQEKVEEPLCRSL